MTIVGTVIPVTGRTKKELLRRCRDLESRGWEPVQRITPIEDTLMIHPRDVDKFYCKMEYKGGYSFGSK